MILWICMAHKTAQKSSVFSYLCNLLWISEAHPITVIYQMELLPSIKIYFMDINKMANVDF